MRTDWLERQAAYSPDARALVWVPTGEAVTYADLDRRATALAGALAAHRGIGAGDRLAVLSENSIAHVVLFAAAQKAGFILVPLNHRLSLPELQHQVADSEPALLFYAEAHRDVALALVERVRCERLDALTALEREGGAYDRPRLQETDPLMLLYTSGTTGRPKGAVISHGMVAWNSMNTGLRLDLTSRDVSFNAAPFYHTGGWNVLLTPFLHRGATTYLLDGFDPGALLRLCDDERVTILWGVPTMMRMLADDPAFASASLASVRYALVGGEPMPEPLIRTWQDKSVPIRQGFGMTEVGVNCFSLPERDAVRKIGSIGLPNLYLEARVVDAHGADVRRGETGELLMAGPVVTPGYWRNPEATAEAIRDGWFHTGDLVRQDDEGYFYVVGRKKDMYISGGENVYPAEVERVLCALPGVEQAAVVGVPDARWGEAGCAYLVAPGGLDADAVRTHCRAHLAAFKVPRDVRFLDALPTGHSGKILKHVLRERAAAPTPTAHA